jgi:hypothetical protein
VIIFAIWGLLVIVGCSLLQLLWMAGSEIREAMKSRATPAVVVTPGVAAAERVLSSPLAELIAEAERKAIAMHSPLAGDPHEAQVVANPVRTAEVTSLVGGGVSHVPVEVTAIGDREPMYLYPEAVGGSVIRPATPDRLVYDLQDRRQMLWEEAKSLYATVSDLQRTFTRREQALWDRLEAEINAIDGRLAACHRNTTCGPGKPSPPSRRQTGHTPEPG